MGVTKPSRGRVALWLVLPFVWFLRVLAFLWFLLLPQYLADDTPHKGFSWPGAGFWVVVLACLLWCAWMTSRQYRARRGAAQTPEAR
jgi:hypothetical protein